MKNTLIILLAGIALVSCTTAHIEKSADLTIIDIKKFHPMGEELAIDGTLNEVGNLQINKKTDNSQETATAVLNGLIDLAAPQ